MALLIDSIGELSTQHLTGEASPGSGEGAGVLRDAAVVLDGERIAWVGPARHAPAADERFDAGGRAVLPGWVDSHSHLVFAGDRTAEFEARMAGQAYAAGGIGVTMAATREASDAELRRLLSARLAEAVAGGTTYLETKTGYGLDVPHEVRSAVLAGEFVDEVTYLGAHLVPAGADAQEYTDLVCGEMLKAVLPHVRWADVFCERGAFSEEQSRRVLTACRDAGLGLRVHGNQLGPGPGVRLAVEFGAASVDHVNFLDEADVEALAGSWVHWTGPGGAPGQAGEAQDSLASQDSWASQDSLASQDAWASQDSLATAGTVATVLPACDLSTRAPLAPARRLLDAGVQVAIASNCNPGTSYTSSVAYCVTTAVLQMGLSVQEAVRAATFGGALALRRHAGVDADGQRAVGSIAVGHRADLQLLDAPSATHLAYRPGMPLTSAVWRAGRRVR
ncbi:imidazolonepropionase [Sinomonas cellulolyticus]|uniref:Imidazolonepropionase n=1 Tax=Sinomonas cellulolyticus TaxID=2801916 RepID=A0ABS1JYK8_9MICC|nr:MULTISPECIES: amidohydrolase family protein [Sinomonas]MBL0704349.1 imidazolonepropionase [Sinomonas cellulolyticus]GHG48145.1 imidazolonepropionase [Sinomonas sp. KCTC 49339]